MIDEEKKQEDGSESKILRIGEFVEGGMAGVGDRFSISNGPFSLED